MAVAMVIPCLLYWCYDKRAGRYALLSFGFSSMFNQIVKNTFCVYRPWIRDTRIVPDSVAIKGANGYSFPSGHAQSTASVMAGLGWYYRKLVWPPVVAILFTLLVAFSRNFLGVHAPQDVLVGVVEGCVFAYVCWKLMEWAEQSEERAFVVLLVGTVLTVVSLVYLTIKPYPVEYVNGEVLVDPKEMLVSCYKSAGALTGILAGLFVEGAYIRFETGNVGVAESAARLLMGALMALVVHKLAGALFMELFGDTVGELFKYALTFFVVSAGAPFFFRPLGNRFFAGSHAKS